MTRALGILALAAALAGVGMMGCQQSGNSNMGQNDGVSQADGMPESNIRADDGQFVQKATAGGNYEVEEGKLAQDKGSSEDVKKIGERMVADHTKAGNELMGIVSQQGLPTPPAGMTEDLQGMVSKLDGLSGADFDKEYLKQQDAAHRETIALFETEAKGGSNAALRSFARKTLPTLRSHLKMITQAEAGTGGM